MVADVSAEGNHSISHACMNVYIIYVLHILQSLPGSWIVLACVLWRSPGGWWPGWRSNLQWPSPVPPADICGSEEVFRYLLTSYGWWKDLECYSLCWYSHHAEVLPLLAINQGKQCPHSLLGKRSTTINADCLDNKYHVGREGWRQTRGGRGGGRDGGSLTLGSYPIWCALHIWKKTV